ncbi:UNVERIFIED_CONTAM: hypothetical protein K2H54_023142 [Gekko kuhli]
MLKRASLRHRPPQSVPHQAKGSQRVTWCPVRRNREEEEKRGGVGSHVLGWAEGEGEEEPAQGEELMRDVPAAATESGTSVVRGRCSFC